MKCPYCGNDMKTGYIKSSHPISWGEEAKLGFIRNDLKLSPVSLKAAFYGHFVEAHRCERCSKIIIDTPS